MSEPSKEFQTLCPRDFLQIEEALTTFLEKLKKSKNNMEVCTNAMVVKELITNQTEIRCIHLTNMSLKVRKWICSCLTITSYNYSKTNYGRIKYVWMNQQCYGEHLTSYQGIAISCFILFCRRKLKKMLFLTSELANKAEITILSARDTTRAWVPGRGIMGMDVGVYKTGYNTLSSSRLQNQPRSFLSFPLIFFFCSVLSFTGTMHKG